MWLEIPSSVVLFICEDDIFKGGLPIYHIHRTIDETGHDFQDGMEIIYVNGQKQDDTPLGLLMHDFHCTKGEDMYYDILKERVLYFKESEGGIGKMCEIMDRIRDNGIQEGKLEGKLEGIKESFQNLIISGFSKEESLKLLNISEDIQKKLQLL